VAFVGLAPLASPMRAPPGPVYVGRAGDRWRTVGMCSAAKNGGVVSHDADERLQAVRAAEETRITAIRTNDSAAIAGILDDLFIYINARGMIYDKGSYVAAVHSRALTYSSDLELTETDFRVDGDVVIIVGLMLGHARIERRERQGEWKLLAWQSSDLLRG
jgi:hypothetical protein